MKRLKRKRRRLIRKLAVALLLGLVLLLFTYQKVNQYDLCPIADEIVFVDLSRKLVWVHDKSYPCIIGKEKHRTPTGAFWVSTIILNPTWLPPDSAWAKDSKITYPGKDNPLGVGALLLKGQPFLIHGGARQGDLQQSVSHGCIRLLNNDFISFVDRLVQLNTLKPRFTVVTGNIVEVEYIPVKKILVRIRR